VKDEALATAMDVELHETLPLGTARDTSSQVLSAHLTFKSEN
jgi:hypothetical protein